ncbi:hypothetical protein [Streptomyces sp. NPDC018693]|uniref:hypothetical protein n=1 Tax=unclassified Streptomyces TaxID=2593676 RepID=UPI0037880C73
MSFGDPNNPYGPPPQNPQQPGQPQQPGYGYPQQNQQPPGYGIPAAPPISQPYPGGPGGLPPMTSMPGTVSAARIMLWVIVGLNVIGACLFLLAGIAGSNADNVDDSELRDILGDIPSGQMYFYSVLAVAWLIWAAVLAVKFKTGGNSLRITTLVFGVLTAILGVFPFFGIGIVHLVLGILIAVFAGNSNGQAWFNRPRY